MNRGDLIERLAKIANPTKGLEAVTSPDDRETIKQAIAALSPVPPEDVQEICEKLRYWKPQAGAQAADLIERLARDKNFIEKVHAKRCIELAEAEQRIAELERIRGMK